MKLSVVIPLYNEESNVKPLLDKIEEALKDPIYGRDIAGEVQFVLVDNGSKDQTRENLIKYSSALLNVKLCYVDTNVGYGNGILQGLNVADGHMLSWTHADLQTDPLDVLKAYSQKIKSNSERVIIKGRRKGRKWSEAFFTWGMQQYVFFKLKVKLSDINAQPKLFDRQFYLSYIKEKAPLDFSLDLFLLVQAQKNNYEILELPVFFNKRHSGEAKGGGSFKTKIKLISRTVKYINEYKENKY